MYTLEGERHVRGLAGSPHCTHQKGMGMANGWQGDYPVHTRKGGDV